MLIRPATNADALAVRELVFSVLAEYGLRGDPEGIDRDLADIEQTYLHPGGTFEVIEDESGHLWGTAGLMPLRKGVCELRKLYLRPEVRGRGLGKRMLERMLDTARKRGFRRLELDTASVLKEAISLYERYGFHRVPLHGDATSRCDAAYALDLARGPLETPNIRSCRAEDAQAVLELLHAAHAWNLANGFNFTAADMPLDALLPRLVPERFWVAELAGRLAGTIEIRPDPEPGRWSFHLLAVAPEARGSGLGQALVAFAEALARRQGAAFLGLDTPENHPWLPAFYERLGYRVVGHAQWEGKRYRSVLMNKPL